MSEPIGPSEFSWGRGLESPPSEGAIPKTHEVLRAVWRNDQPDRNLDPGAVASVEDYVREPPGSSKAAE